MTRLDRTLVSRVLADVATAEDFQSLGVENVVAIKRDPNNLQIRNQPLSKRLPQIDEENRISTLEVSNDFQDRSGDRVRTRGIDLSEYKRNPIHLFGHRDDDPRFVMGRTEKATKTREAGPDRTALIHSVRWLDADTNPTADMVFRMQAQGVLVASSIRFRPIKANRPKTQREREKLGIGEFGVDFEKVFLMESSTVSIPDNQLATAKSVLDQWAEAGVYSWGAISDLEKALETDTRTVVALGGLTIEGADDVEIEDNLDNEEQTKKFLDDVEDAARRGTLKALEQHSKATRATASGDDGGNASDQPSHESAPDSRDVDPFAYFRNLFQEGASEEPEG